MEDQKHQLAEEDAAEKDPSAFNGPLHPGGAVGETPVKGEAGEAAEEKGACVEDVGDKVQDFGAVDSGVGEDVLDVLDVAARTQPDEDDGKGDKRGIGELEQY